MSAFRKSGRETETASGRSWLEQTEVAPDYRELGSRPIAVLSDIHSNIHALERVFTECTIRGVDRFFCLGDTVGYAAYPRQCLTAIRRLNCPTVMGNHDQAVAKGGASAGLNAMARAGIDYSVLELDAEQRWWLHNLPMSLTIGAVTLVHASAVMPHLWYYILTQLDAEFSMSEQHTPICFFGHTHHQKLFKAERSTPPVQIAEEKWRLDPEGAYMINPGSVGQPRGGGDSRAQFAIYDPVALTVEFVRVDYDVGAAIKGIMIAGLPGELAERLILGM